MLLSSGITDTWRFLLRMEPQCRCCCHFLRARASVVGVAPISPHPRTIPSPHPRPLALAPSFVRLPRETLLSKLRDFIRRRRLGAPRRSSRRLVVVVVPPARAAGFRSALFLLLLAPLRGAAVDAVARQARLTQRQTLRGGPDAIRTRASPASGVPGHFPGFLAAESRARALVELSLCLQERLLLRLEEVDALGARARGVGRGRGGFASSARAERGESVVPATRATRARGRGGRGGGVSGGDGGDGTGAGGAGGCARRVRVGAPPARTSRVARLRRSRLALSPRPPPRRARPSGAA